MFFHSTIVRIARGYVIIFALISRTSRRFIDFPSKCVVASSFVYERIAWALHYGRTVTLNVSEYF